MNARRSSAVAESTASPTVTLSRDLLGTVDRDGYEGRRFIDSPSLRCRMDGCHNEQLHAGEMEIAADGPAGALRGLCAWHVLEATCA